MFWGTTVLLYVWDDSGIYCTVHSDRIGTIDLTPNIPDMTGSFTTEGGNYDKSDVEDLLSVL